MEEDPEEVIVEEREDDIELEEVESCFPSFSYTNTHSPLWEEEFPEEEVEEGVEEDAEVLISA